MTHFYIRVGLQFFQRVATAFSFSPNSIDFHSIFHDNFIVSYRAQSQDLSHNITVVDLS